MDSITTVVQITVEVLASEIKNDKDLKSMDWEGRNKVVFADGMYVYVENTKGAKNKAKLLEQIKKREAERCKINTVK